MSQRPGKLSTNKAAAQERACWLRKIRRLLRRYADVSVRGVLVELEAWGRERAARAARRPGGLGKR